VIHPTAIVHPGAKLDPSVEVGPYAVIDGDVEIGPGCVIGPRVYITGRTRIGAGNRFHAGAVIGDAPQDLKYRGEPTGVRIGHNNVFREHCTVHRSTIAGEETVIGSNNYLMVNSHVGHNAVVGDHVILANGALLGGHAVVQDRAFLSGNCLVHQFVRVGTLAMMQGGTAVSQDIPPFTLAHEVNRICGLNIVGLRRAGFSPDERLELKKLYGLLFRRNRPFREALDEAERLFTSRGARILIEFARTTKRGLCADSGGRGREEGAGEPME